MFACRIWVVSTHAYSIIWINTNLTCLLIRPGFLNPNKICLLNGLVISTYLSAFIKVKKNTNLSINRIELNYEKPNKYIFLIENLKLTSNCIKNFHSKLKHISILQIINQKMSNKINDNN